MDHRSPRGGVGGLTPPPSLKFQKYVFSGGSGFGQVDVHVVVVYVGLRVVYGFSNVSSIDEGGICLSLVYYGFIKGR